MSNDVMVLRLCQLKSRLFIFLILVSLNSCSWLRQKSIQPIEVMNTFSNKWFSANPKHSLVGADGEPVSHILFDTSPEFNPDKKTVNAIVATPEGSPYGYSIDLSSGQRYFSHSYCKQSDAWNLYSKSIDRPIFSIGFIPRVLDQLGEPQKVIIWSKNKSFSSTVTTNYHKVKLVGAFVEQVCPEGNCQGKSNWLSRLVFIGVDGTDPLLSEIKNIAEFKNHFKWDDSKAYLENIEGQNFIGEQKYPAIKIGQLIEYEDAFNYFKKRSIFLTEMELKKIQKGCHALYDRLWNEVGVIRKEDLPVTEEKALVEKLKLKAELTKKKLPVGFSARFTAFTEKYFNEISTCEKFVYHGNINKDREQYWFFSYVGLFYRLHREGYFFNCQLKNWQKNVLNDEGEPIYDLKKSIRQCKDQDFDQAMSYIPNFLKSLKNEKDFYRFIDYDNRSFGTHNKMYNWVKIKTRKLSCTNDPNLKITHEIRVSPEDSEWQHRYVKDLESEIKIIY